VPRLSRLPALSLLSALLMTASPAAAQTLTGRAPPAHRVVHRSLLALRANPIGLLFDGRIGYRLRLYRDEGLALRDNYAGAGAALAASPAYVRVGPYVEVAPASVVTLWASAQYASYFGSFGLVQSFQSPRDNFDDDELDRRDELDDGDPLANYSTSGLELTLGLDLQARVGPVAVRAQNRLIRADLDLRAEDTVFYDQTTDLLVPDEGFAYVGDLDAAYLALDGRLIVALRYTASIPLYPDDAYLPRERRDSDNATQRLGPVLAYSFYSRDGAALNAPTVLLLAQWWLDHRYRTGEESSQALPLVAVGLRIHGDLLPMAGAD
jgi:hypothetical protein